MKKSIALAASGTMLVTALVGLTATTASAGASCGHAAPADKDGSSWPTATVNVNIRTGSSTSCTSVGILAAGQRADYYCYTVNTSSGATWTYLRDVATGVQGWVRDDNLPRDGSTVYCGF